MTKLLERDYIYAVWRDAKSRSRFVIGELSRNGKYEFKYNKEHIEKAFQSGFTPFVSFPDRDKKYVSEELFAVFASRLPDKKRRNIGEILDKYDLDEYDAFELLKKTGGKTPIDTLEFIEPIFMDELESNEMIKREFFIAGTQYHDFCNKNDKDGCTLNYHFDKLEELRLVLEPTNEHDKYAVRVDTQNQKFKIGYIPAYYSEQVFKALDSGYKVRCVVKKIDTRNCQECIEAILEIKK